MKTALQTYPKYKDSGVEWLGEIPEEWVAKRLKYTLQSLESGSRESQDSLPDDANIPSIGGEHITWNGNVKFTNNKFITEEYFRNLKKGRIEKEDTLLVKDGATIGKTAFVEHDQDMAVNEHVFILRPLNGINPKLIYYFIVSDKAQKLIRILSQGAAQAGLSSEFASNIFITLPNKIGQDRIINFLDQKTAKIDQLIQKNKKLIKLLEEKRQAVITQAVTKGLDPYAEMKDSGMKWIGEIPKHWELKRLRYTGSCQNGINKSADYFGHGFPFVSYSDVYRNHVLPRQVEELVASSEKDRDNYSVRKGDVFFTRTSETVEEIGLASTCMEGIKDAVFAGFLIRFKPNKGLLFDGFSKYYFRSQLQRAFFVKEMNLVTRTSLSQELLKNMPIILPSIQEQSSIVSYLDRETAKIDGLKANTKKLNILLEEYRQALISNVVTGKVKVN